MENQERRHRKKKMDHFSHKHPLILVEIGEEEEEMSKSDQYRSFLRCYGCTEKIGSGVPYYRCEEYCPLFCLHHACAHLPTTINNRLHSIDGCDGGELQLKGSLHQNHQSCSVCGKEWYSFAYVCSVCGLGVDMRCATRKPNEAKHSFHQHPLQPYFSPPAGDLICSVCTRIITRWGKTHDICLYYNCNYCNFIVHPQCTNVPAYFQSPSHPHKLFLDFHYLGSQICKICLEEIDLTTQWAYKCTNSDCDYYIHAAANDDCLTSTIRKGDLQHFGHHHPLALIEETDAPLDDTSSDADHTIAPDCHCCTQKISSSVPYYTCVHCNYYHLHQLCAHLPTEIDHPLHPKCPLKLQSRLSAICDVCDQTSSGFFYNCSPCGFDIDIGCALRTQRTNTIYHKHPLFLSHTKGPFNCHACDRDTQGTSYRCTSCQFWVHQQCASLPTLKEISSHKHEHDLELVYTIPEKYPKIDVFCRICTKALKHHRWAYHCNLCRYLTHIHDCSDPHREGDEFTIDPSEVVHLPLAGEPIVEEQLTNGKMTKHYRHPMILFADQLESSAIDITYSFMNLIRGSSTWPIFKVDGIDYSGITFSFYNNTLTMQVTSVDLPRFVKHESHPHVLESTFLNSSTRCHACEQSFFGHGFKCTTCAFTIDTYCGLLPRMIKHRYDKHGFSLTYSAIEGIEEYVCEICEKDVTPRYFYHCEHCDQSIHARCIWQAYVRFEPYYKILRVHQYGVLVPPGQDLPKCIICDQKETFGHGFAFLGEKNNEMFKVHLPTTIRRWHSLDTCDGELRLKRHPVQNKEFCLDCLKEWYGFAYVCSDCGLAVDIRCSAERAKRS